MQQTANAPLDLWISYAGDREMGSKALGICIKRHRGRRSQKVLADMVERSMRWMAYVEAGKTDVGWSDLVSIATALGRIEGRAFLDDAMSLLYEEANVDVAKKDAFSAVQRRAFLGVLGSGAVASQVDVERIGQALQGMHAVDSALVGEMEQLGRLYTDQSRVMAPAIALPAVRLHLQNYLELLTEAPSGIADGLKKSAAEMALLAGVLSYRTGQTPEALRHWLLASALAAESQHDLVSAYVVGTRITLLNAPAARGGSKDGDPRKARSGLDQALALAGPRPAGILGMSLYCWRASNHALLGDATAAARDLESASKALGKPDSVGDPTGVGIRSELDLSVERVICAVELGRPAEVESVLDAGRAIASHPSLGWQAARTSELAAAHAQRGAIDQAAGTLLKAVDLAIASKDLWRVRWVQGIRERWIPANFSSEALGEVDSRLGAVLPATA
jgi:hypothetical protein